MHILALVPGGIGDQLLFFPTLESIKQKFPSASIDVMVEPRSKSAYRVCPYVNEVIPFDFKDRNGLADYLNLLGIIRDREYEVAITLGRRFSVGFLLWLNGIPTRIGYELPTSWCLSNPIPCKQNQYAGNMYHDLVQGLGITTPCPPMKIAVPKSDITWAEEEQNRLDIKNSGYVLIHGGSSKLALKKGINKLYPLEKWQAIIRDIQTKQPTLPIVLVEGPEDTEWVKNLQENSSSLKVTSPPDIGKLAGMIAGANLMLCTDSAPMHLSIAVGTYTIALFGPTDSKKLIPPNNDRIVALQSPSKSIADIEPQTVLEQIWRG